MMKNKKTPKIRFKGFVDEWEETPLNGIALINPKAVLPDVFEYVDLESVIGTEMIAHREETRETAPSRAQRLAIKGDVFYQTVRPYQKNNYLFDLDFTNYVFSTGYAQMRPFNHSYFLLSILQTNEFVKSVLLRCTGTSYPAINSTDLANLEVRYPKNNTEQTHIGNFFQNIDNLIQLNKKKLEKLKNVKKASLEKMFPKKGATTPEIRFKGCSGEWEEKKIGDLGTIITGSTPTTLDSSNYGGVFLFVSPADIQENRYIEQTLTCLSEKGFKQGRQLDVGAILFVSIGSTIGKVAQLTQIATTNQQINSIIPNENIKSDFAFSLFSNNATYIKSFAATQAVPILNKTNFSNIEIRVSNDLGEQINIGSYFKRLDNLISKQQAQLTKLKNIKKACLDKMFVTKE